jgi:hypothetical protein
MRASIIFFMLDFFVGINAFAQSSWSQIYDQHGIASWAMHGVLGPNGEIFVIVQVENVHGAGHGEARVYSIDPVSTLLGDVQLQYPGHTISTAAILYAADDQTLNVPSAVQDPISGNTGSASCVALFKLDLELQPIFSGIYGPCAQQHDVMTATLGPDNTIALAYTSMDPSGMGEHVLRTQKIGLNGDSLSGSHLMTTLGWGSVAGIKAHRSGGYVMMNEGFDVFQQSGITYATYLDGELRPVVSSSMATVSPGGGYFNYPSRPLDGIALENGDLIFSGYFWRTFEDRGSVVRRTDSAGVALATWEYASEFYMDVPAVIQALDRAPNGNIFFAQNENDIGFWYPFYPDIAPSRVRVVELDTDLNLVGEFLIDGFPENRLYSLSSVVASSDGGAYVMGAVTDLNDPNGKPKAWVQKIGPEQIVAVHETEQYSATLFPNPGHDGFDLRTTVPVTKATLTLIDATGRSVEQIPFNGSSLHVPAQKLPVGLYFVRVIADDGVVLFTGQWVKN